MGCFVEVRSNAQPSFMLNRKLNTESPYIEQNNLLQMNADIKKEPAFDVKQAIRKLAERLRAMSESAEEQTETKLPTKLELYELLSPYGTTYKEIKNAYPQTAHDEEQVNLLNREFDPTDSNMVNLADQMMDLAFEKMKEKEKINPDNPRLTDYELYEIWSPYGARYRQIREERPTPEQEEKIKQDVEQAIKISPIPKLYIAPHAVDSGIGVLLANSDYVTEKNKEMKKYISEESTVGQVITYGSDTWEDEACKALEEFIITVNNIGDSIEGNVEIIEWLCDKWSKNEPLRRLGIFAGKILRVWDGYQCFRNTYKKREEEIGRIMKIKECTREEAEAEVRRYLPLWLTGEIMSMGLGMFIEDKVKERLLFPKDNKTILWEDYGT